MKTIILFIAKTTINSEYKTLIESTKRNVMDYVGRRNIEDFGTGLPIVTFNCVLSEEDKKFIQDKMTANHSLNVIFFETEKELSYGDTIKFS